jgi:hypothetical protein
VAGGEHWGGGALIGQAVALLKTHGASANPPNRGRRISAGGGTIEEGTDFGLGLDMLIHRSPFNRMSDRLSGPSD